MTKLKYIVHLIDFIGHPSITGEYLNERRFEALANIIKSKEWTGDKVIINTLIPPTDDWTIKHKYKEQFLELQQIAIKSGIEWFDINEDTNVFEIITTLKERGYSIDPSYTRIIIGGTNTSGCVLKNKAACIETYAQDGFRTKLFLPLCAECEAAGINDLEKTWNALSKVYTYVVESRIHSLVELHFEQRKLFER